jgi:addiction module RelE/StbE family toxin
MARIVWSRQANDDLRDIIEYISRDSPTTARRFARKIISRVEQLKRMPLCGGYVLEDASRTYRELVQGNYRIIYRCDGQTVYLITVRHAARLLHVDDLDIS